MKKNLTPLIPRLGKEKTRQWLMRLTVLKMVLVLSLLSTYGRVNSQMIISNLKLENVDLSEALERVEDLTDYDFIFSYEDVEGYQVTVDLQSATLEDCLNTMFEEIPFVFITEKDVVIVSYQKPEPVSTEEQQEKKVITGKVSDKEGNPLPGVSVVFKGTNVGVATNIDGEYTLDFIDANYTLVFSFVGMISQEVDIMDQDIQNVILEYDMEQISELVVIGYGSQNRKEVTGSVVTVKSEDIVKNIGGNASSFDSALGGLMKGVNVTQNSGAPGSGVSINIRGYTSPLSGGTNQPLYIIDGVQFNTDASFDTGSGTEFIAETNPLLSLNPESIENISVLKDAAATAIYGSRGANGVIIVTTKKGKRGEKAVVDFSAQTTFAKPIGKVAMMNASEFKNYHDVLMINSVDAANKGQMSPFSLYGFTDGVLADLALDFGTFQYTYNGLNPDFFGNEDTNWQKEIYRSQAQTQKYNLNIRGGSELTDYTIGANFTNQEGLFLNEKFKQYSFNAKVNSQINDIVKVGTSVNLAHTNNKNGEAYSGSGALNLARSSRPDIAVRNDEGQFNRVPNYAYGPGFLIGGTNPVQSLQNRNELRGYNLFANAYVEAEVVKNLRIKAEGVIGYIYSDNSQFQKKSTMDIFPIPGYENQALLLESESVFTNYLLNLTANYGFSINDHSINVLIGQSWDRRQKENGVFWYQGFPDDEVLVNASNANELVSYKKGKAENGLNSIFARATYNFKNKYFATMNFRSDASSKFGPENKHGYFPSASLGWNITQEDFFDSSFVNNLKLRTSVGRTGTDNIADFTYIQFFERDGKYNEAHAVTFKDNLPNPAIKWETTDEFNIGVDFSILDNRVFGDVDLYTRKTKGAISPAPIALELGTSNYTSNAMDISNKGVEIQLGADVFRSSKQDGFNWRTVLNYSVNRNKLENLHGANISSSVQDYIIEGEALGTFKGYLVDGIFQSQSEVDGLNTTSMTQNNTVYDQAGTSVGDYKFVDVNGDGHITLDDKVILGSSEPDFFGGITNSFSYKGFELMAHMQFSVGAEASWGTQRSTWPTFGQNLPKIFNNSWTTENTEAKYPRLVSSNPGRNDRLSSEHVYSTSYLRLKTLQLKYNVSQKFVDKVGVKKLSMSLSASNLFTITDWPGVDPEALSGSSIKQRGENNDPYPIAKTITLGVNVQF